MDEQTDEGINNNFQEQEQNQNIPEKKSTAKKVLKIFLLSILILFIIAIISACYIYFFKISPRFIEKPIIEKPIIQNLSEYRQIINSPEYKNRTNYTAFPTPEAIKQEHIIFLLNEIGAYKLHNSLNGDSPRIKFIITDLNKEYFFSVANNKILEIEEVSNLDITIKANQDTIIEVYDAKNTKEAILSSYNKGEIELEIIADTSSLAFKGYMVLYNYFGITGNIISKIF